MNQILDKIQNYLLVEVRIVIFFGALMVTLFFLQELGAIILFYSYLFKLLVFCTILL